MAYNDPHWFMLREDLHQIKLHYMGQVKEGKVEGGTLLVSYDALPRVTSDLYLKVQTIENTEFAFKCQRKFLIDLHEKDLQWLQPIFSPKERIRVFNDQRQWQMRNMLEKGTSVYFVTRTSKVKVKATVQQWRYSEVYKGNIIDIQVNQVISNELSTIIIIIIVVKINNTCNLYHFVIHKIILMCIVGFCNTSI